MSGSPTRNPWLARRGRLLRPGKRELSALVCALHLAAVFASWSHAWRHWLSPPPAADCACVEDGRSPAPYLALLGGPATRASRAAAARLTGTGGTDSPPELTPPGSAPAASRLAAPEEIAAAGAPGASPHDPSTCPLCVFTAVSRRNSAPAEPSQLGVTTRDEIGRLGTESWVVPPLLSEYRVNAPRGPPFLRA